MEIVNEKHRSILTLDLSSMGSRHMLTPHLSSTKSRPIFILDLSSTKRDQSFDVANLFESIKIEKIFAPLEIYVGHIDIYIYNHVKRINMSFIEFCIWKPLRKIKMQHETINLDQEKE